jgi:hypothetical protein
MPMLFEVPAERLAPVDDEIKAYVAHAQRLVGPRLVPTMLRMRAYSLRQMERLCAGQMNRWDLVARHRALAEACLKRAEELEPANE